MAIFEGSSIDPSPDRHCRRKPPSPLFFVCSVQSDDPFTPPPSALLWAWRAGSDYLTGKLVSCHHRWRSAGGWCRRWTWTAGARRRRLFSCLLSLSLWSLFGKREKRESKKEERKGRIETSLLRTSSTTFCPSVASSQLHSNGTRIILGPDIAGGTGERTKQKNKGAFLSVLFNGPSDQTGRT